MTPRVTIDRTGFVCGHCGTPVDFRHIRRPFPGAWYVHRSDRRFRCYGRRWWGANTNSAPLTRTLLDNE